MEGYVRPTAIVAENEMVQPETNLLAIVLVAVVAWVWVCVA